MANRFCSSCGAKLLPDSNFCVECGERQAGAPATSALASFSLQRYAPVLVLVAVVAVVGVVVAVGIRNPKTSPTVPRRGGSEAPAETSGGTLPQGHPPIAIPEEVKQAIRDMTTKADAAPEDLDTWRHLADIEYRASQLDATYLTKADAAYHHVLEREPNNPDVLRSLGNIAFDQDRHDDAVGFYKQYLKIKPDDLDVQTDLGTMYLSTGNADQAIQQYESVLKQNPSFFQAQFNLAIAYRTAGQTDKIVPALEKARTMATDDRTRNQVDEVLARVKGGPPPEMPGGAAPAVAGGAAPEAAAGAPPAADTFEAGIDAIFRQHPIIGPKLDHIEWPTGDSAKVYLHDFPMDQMPPEMLSMFTDRMQAKIKEQKLAHQVTQATRIDLIDKASGKVMSTITE